MAVKLRPKAEPLSYASRVEILPHPQGKPKPEPIMARSQAADVLHHELGRYCDGELRGRSFLVAGHRGTGKTTMVDGAIRDYQLQALKQAARFKPIPVYVQGPIILPTSKPSAPWEANKDDGEPKSLEQRLLIEVAQALHQAVTKEFVDRLHFHALLELDAAERVPASGTGFARLRPNYARARLDAARELAELAARFHIELNQAPTPLRLQTFWQEAGIAEHGILFNSGHSRGRQQGLRELIALNGVTHVYERIAGEVKSRTATENEEALANEVASTAGDAKFVELIKPLSALTAGTVVGGSSAFAGNTVWALVLGVLTAIGANLLLKVTTTSTRNEKRKVDTTFIPNLDSKTLHRVMPELFERLQAAGLAPVIIVDELDKVDNLYDQIHPLLDSFKKLFAERAFTCLLVDRGFYEQLHLRERVERQVR